MGSGEAKDAYGVSVWALSFERISCGLYQWHVSLSMEGQEELSTNTMKVRRLLEESFVKIQVPSGDLPTEY